MTYIHIYCIHIGKTEGGGGSLRKDITCFILLSLCNVCTALTGADAEATVRSIIQSGKKLDILRIPINALFIVNLLAMLSRVPHYCSILVEEAVLPFFISMIEKFKESQEMITACTEGFVNLSIDRKNRRYVAVNITSYYITLHHIISHYIVLNTSYVCKGSGDQPRFRI